MFKNMMYLCFVSVLMTLISTNVSAVKGKEKNKLPAIEELYDKSKPHELNLKKVLKRQEILRETKGKGDDVTSRIVLYMSTLDKTNALTQEFLSIGLELSNATKSLKQINKRLSKFEGQEQVKKTNENVIDRTAQINQLKEEREQLENKKKVLTKKQAKVVKSNKLFKDANRKLLININKELGIDIDKLKKLPSMSTYKKNKKQG